MLLIKNLFTEDEFASLLQATIFSKSRYISYVRGETELRLIYSAIMDEEVSNYSIRKIGTDAVATIFTNSDRPYIEKTIYLKDALRAIGCCSSESSCAGGRSCRSRGCRFNRFPHITPESDQINFADRTFVPSVISHTLDVAKSVKIFKSNANNTLEGNHPERINSELISEDKSSVKDYWAYYWDAIYMNTDFTNGDISMALCVTVPKN